MDGPGNIVIRSVFVAACALWASIDVGIVVWRKPWNSLWKPSAICAFASVVLIATMYVMGWLLRGKLTEQQEDVFRGLKAVVYLPPSGNPMDSMFKITNDSGTEVGRHQLFCGVNLIVFEGENITWRGGAGTIIHDSSIPLAPGGDAQSDACLAHTIGGVRARCADITLRIDYVLTTQPADIRSKSFRFVSRETDGFVWHQQPIGAALSHCEHFVVRR